MSDVISSRPVSQPLLELRDVWRSYSQGGSKLDVLTGASLTVLPGEMKALVGRNGYLMRRLVGEVVRNADDKRLTESQLLEMLGLESIQSLIRKRKLQWVAHCARRGEEDLSWKRIVREVEDGKSKCNFV